MESAEDQLKEIAAQLRKPSGDAGIGVGKMMNQGNLNINLAAIEALRLQGGERVLEIGMGNGHFAGQMIECADGVHYTGYDYSPEMIQEASLLNQLYVQLGKATFKQGDIHHMPFDNQQFDAVLSVNTIYFWDKPENAIGQVNRVMKTGGRLVLGIRPEHAIKNYAFTKYGFSYWSRAKTCEFLEKNGFDIKEVSETVEGESEFLGQKLLIEHLIVSALKR